ncbi:MAG TPA: penicillin-binding protein 2 [Terriglobales bacterium]|jgi:penicillin-binding protein 2|nr:penicillin-binding protein 2 [Terriglobales bacterium]
MFGRDEKVSPMRLTAAQYAILAIFLVLTYGLWRLQVSRNDLYASLAEKNRVRDVPMLAPRGKILDREGRVIVDNYPSFSALLMRDSVRNLNDDADAIAGGLHMDAKEIKDRIRKFAGMPQYQPIFLKDDITPDELAFIEAHRNELPELDTIMAHRRLYPRNGFMAHVIGYVGEVSEDMLNSPRWELYNPGDVVGKSGIELEYNHILMGQNGSRQVVVNSHGREMGQLDEKPATAGKDLKLTIDIDLQIAAEQALGDKNGAIVAMDPRNGEILAMVSRPTFDPNNFAVRITRDQWVKLATDDEHPLLNKAIQAQLAPGSTFKIIMATAGLQEGIAQNLRVNCPGGATFYGRYFRCWIAAQHHGHGVVDISKGIYQSCDVFFYTLADRLGITRMAKYATEFGLGQKTGIDLPQEASGLMPSEEWKIRNYRQKWYAGENMSVGIGQGAVVATPMQMTRALSAIASGGLMVTPHVTFTGDVQPNPNLVQASVQPSRVSIPIDPKNWEVITDAMAEVPGPLGTANSAHLQGIDFAGKTGSAQTISNTLKAKLANGKQDFKDNAWFVGVTPRRSPEFVVGVLFEGGEHGQFAARLAAQVVKSYVEKQRRTPTKVASAPRKVEIGAVWSTTDHEGQQEDFKAGHFTVDLPKRRLPLALAAPGLVH